MNSNSMRLNPYWNKGSGIQLTGLIHLMCNLKNRGFVKQNYVEVGSYFGESALIASSFDFIDRIFCIDLFNQHNQIESCKKLLSHTKKPIEYIKQESIEAVNIFEDKSIDILYIDACHSYECVKDDLNCWHTKVRDGGFICGHDYNPKSHSAVIKAVDEFVELKNLKIDQIFCDTSFLIVNN